MKFRGSTNSTPRNDGLPIVNGRKVRHRRGFGSQQAIRSRTNMEVSRIASFLQGRFWFVFIVPVVLFLFHVGKDKTGGEDSGIKKGVNVPQEASEESVTSTAKKAQDVSPSKGDSHYPNQCTPEQLARVEKQLPDDPLNFRPWRDAAFSIATLRSNFAHNPILMREFYASDNFKLDKEHSFFGVVMGWQNNDVPIDTLAIGSRDTKFNTQKWNEKLNLDPKAALPPVAINSDAGKRPARVLVVNWDQQKALSLQSLKNEHGYSDDELALESVQLDDRDKLLTTVQSKIPATNPKSHPIHYLDISYSISEDVNILKALKALLHEVRFLHFEYNKEKEWKTTKLSTMMDFLKNEGLVCYFAGKKEIDYGLWRITDCFLQYWDHRHWAGIDCVNVAHEDVRELAIKMENK